MQVIIESSDNERPILEVLDPICVEAGTLILDTVTSEDPDYNDIKLEAFGGPFEFISSPANYYLHHLSFKELQHLYILIGRQTVHM